jgi:catechol 2,3-dioxygenase-like lactoylglutathione lyase family enzyme
MIEIMDLNHVTLIVKDVAAAKHFYCDVLGMEQVTLPPSFTHATIWFRKRSAEIHLVHQPDASQEPGDPPSQVEGDRDVSRSRHLAFAVTNIEGARRGLAEHGLPIVLGPRPRGDGAMQMFCYDPDGHLVELHTLPPGDSRGW